MGSLDQVQPVDKPEGLQKSVLAFLFGFIVAYKAVNFVLVLGALVVGVLLGHFIWT